IAYRGPANRDVIVGIRGIYLGPKGRVLGPVHGTTREPGIAVEAKPGYAVSGLGVRFDWAVNGFDVFFMKIMRSADALDPADFYVSDYIGAQSGKELRYCANDGRLVLGFGAQAGADLNEISLFQPPPPSFDPPPTKILAADNASDYDQTWEKSPSKGVGFGPWQFTASDPTREAAGFGLGSSRENGPPTPSGLIDVAGKSWMMRAAKGHKASALRKFSGGPLRPGQQLCLSMDNAEVPADGRLGFSLQNANGESRLEVYLESNGKNYLARCNGGELNLGFGTDANGINIVFTQLANNHFLLDLRGPSHFGAIPGIIAASDISQIELYDQGGGDK
ncbi:MAG TPA: hypothetical protein VGH90_00285, partial [Chthoniobacteraceae bacterium]